MDKITVRTSPNFEVSPRVAWPLRILLFPLTRLALATAILFVVGSTLLNLRDVALNESGSSSGSPLGVLSWCLIAACLCLAYAAYVRLVERRRPGELGLRGAAREYLIGIVVGCGLMCAVIAVMAAVGVYHVDGLNPEPMLSASLFGALFTGILEELAARCIWLRVLDEWLGTWPALVISSSLFGLAHAGNPGASVWTSVAIAVDAGFMLGAAFLVTRRLWLSAGMHAAWNFTQGGIFGVNVSGGNAEGLFKARLIGSDWLTGGDFGPEASLITMLLCVFAGTWLLAFARKRGTWSPPFWIARRSASDPTASAGIDNSPAAV
jgi:membrane protease YdiL (CAAX protease family)